MERAVGVEVSKKGHSKVTFRPLELGWILSDGKPLMAFEQGLVCKNLI